MKIYSLELKSLSSYGGGASQWTGKNIPPEPFIEFNTEDVNSAPSLKKIKYIPKAWKF